MSLLPVAASAETWKSSLTSLAQFSAHMADFAKHFWYPAQYPGILVKCGSRLLAQFLPLS